ncbi:hypothetical protein Fot_10504 [Forsythia ovata]|uniref:Uncharacterized protein n=1 Tax=Forsythia ovata TaxID=205694 RepID=A0ABD1WH18_9LAMI
MIFAELSLKGGEKYQDAHPTSANPRQTTLVPNVLPRVRVEGEEDGKGKTNGTCPEKARKPRTTSSRSPHNLAVEDDEDVETNRVAEPQGLEGSDYDQLVHIRKTLEGGPSDINPEVFNMISPHLQRALTTVDSFWTHGWANYYAKLVVKAKLSAVKAVAARSLVLIEEI